MNSQNYDYEIKYEIGEIIQFVQYIEWNLLLRLGIDTNTDFTFGTIVGLVEKKELLPKSKLQELSVIVDIRNDIVHKYFKRLDFEKHFQNLQFLNSQWRCLQKIRKKVNDFNSWLVEYK